MFFHVQNKKKGSGFNGKAKIVIFGSKEKGRYLKKQLYSRSGFLKT